MPALIRNAVAVLASLMLSAASPAAAQLAPVAAGSPEILANVAEIRAHMAVLADDLLEGREAGTRGDALAQLYIASRMAAYGLIPAGDEGGYLQRFGLRASRLAPDSVRFAITGPAGERAFANGSAVVVFASQHESEQTIEAPLVFAGYGIDAPDHGIDDYADIDARGKVVVVLGGPPPFLPAAEAAHHGSSGRRQVVAQRAGAIGLIQLWTPALETRFPWDGIASLIGRTEMTWLDADNRPRSAAPAIRVQAFAHGAAADALLAGTGRTAAELIARGQAGSPAGFTLPSRLTFARRSTHDDSLASANVAGLIEGSDPDLKDEIVVFTAHYDHVGIGPAVDGDEIYNGALDNALGTAGLLEVARLMSIADAPPRRSVLFLAVGAEEKGLIGSDFFAERPTVPADAIVANINFDGMIPFYDFSDVVAFGAEESQMGERLC